MNIFIITISGIAVFLVMFFVLFHSPNDGSVIPQTVIKPEHYDIEITGLQDTYLVGEPYSFSYILSGFGDPCGGIYIIFPINKTASSGTDSLPQCLKSVQKDFVLDVQKIYGTTYGHVALQEAGNYTVQVTFEKGTHEPTVATKSFLVVKDCNGKDGKKELDCFANSFESCTPAMINYVLYTIEGDPGFLEAYVEGGKNCYIRIVFDNTQDRFSSPSDRIITKDKCSSIEFTKHTMNIANCTNFLEYQLNYQSPDWASDKKCTSIGGKWNYEFHNCVELPDVTSCENNGGVLSCMSYDQAGHGRDICNTVCDFEVKDKK
jgi:hypothetical protein